MNGSTHWPFKLLNAAGAEARSNAKRTSWTTRLSVMVRFGEGFASGLRGPKLNGECEVLESVWAGTWRAGAMVAVRQINASSARGFARRAVAQAHVPLSLLAVGSAAVVFAVTFHMGSVRAPRARVGLETMMTMFAIAAACLLWAQLRSSRRLRDKLLVAAALVQAVTSLGVSALPAALGLGAGKYFPSAELWSQLAVGGLLAAAALTPRDRLIVQSAQPGAITGMLCLCALAITGLGSLLSGWQAAAKTSNLAHALPHPLLIVVVLGATLPAAYAARAVVRLRREEADRVVTLLAAAALLLAGASLSDLVTRSLAPERIGADAGLRILACSLILSAALIAEYRVRGRLASSAALAERRRVARDLHDGLAQDLAIIAAHGPSIAREIGDEHPVAVAARRALAISRSTISELTDPEGASAHESLEAVAQELRDRFAVTIAVDTQLQVDLEPRAREHVTRIAREAIANAARHGRAQNVVVSLTHSDRGVALRVVDDGCGIPQTHSDSSHDGFGLRSMRERAAALGGSLRVAPAKRGGTELEVVLP
jgi:signal transduction histidine kinase